MGYYDKIKSKIVTLPQLVETLSRRGSKVVVFTNGCFDLVHRGHVEYLSKARDLGDMLIVGLNTDASVRRLKGYSRPVSNQESRAMVMASFEFVDYVVLFDEDTPLELIQAVKPDVLVKGADYNRKNVVGADFVEMNGGRVELIELVPGESTTNLINRMKK